MTPIVDPAAWSAAVRKDLDAAGLPADLVASVIRRALAEDFADGPDVTTLSTIDPDQLGRGEFAARQSGVLAGGPIAQAVLETLAGQVECVRLTDGSRMTAGTVAIQVRGPVAGLLTAERTALNLLGHLSGIATTTRAWMDAVAGSNAAIRDTRKTLPGLRALEKYAVRCGGGVNHRMSLGDAILIKDNHIAAAGSVTAAVAAVRARRPDLPVEVEVDTLDQFDEALATAPDIVLLDNFSLADTAEAVRRRADRAVKLESSGGLTLDRAAAVAATGVDYLSVGGLTHSAPVLDLGLDLTVSS